MQIVLVYMLKLAQAYIYYAKSCIHSVTTKLMSNNLTTNDS